MCEHRVERGEEPMCVVACLARARVWGDLDDPESEVSKLIATREYKRLNEEAGTDPMRRSELIHSVAQSIAVIPDAITRQVYTQDCAVQLNVSELLLTREVSKLRNGKAEAELTKKDHRQEAVQQPSEPVTETKPAASIFNGNMLNLLRLIVRYGERVLCETEDGRQVRCGDYILDDLREDGIEPRNEVHRKMMNEYAAHCSEPGFKAENFFLHHADSAISSLAAELVTDRYQLSRIFSRQSISENVTQEVKLPTDEDILPELTSQMLLETKLTVINEQIEALRAAVEKAEKEDDWNKVRSVLARQPQLMEIRAQICKELGNRIITI